MFNLKSKKLFSLLFLGLIVSSFIFWPRLAEAILGGFGFGGIILGVTPCLNGILFTIGPPRGGLFMWMPGTLIFAYAQLRPGPWALGGYTPGGSCILPTVPPIIIPALGTMTMIGTSP